MVSKTEEASSEVAGSQQQEPSLPKGLYHLVGFDLDLTGRRLIDEIVQIAGYTPQSTFSQYVLPFRYLNNEARYRHLLRVITVSRYRMLKSDKTGKILKTKSEISAVTDFVQWLESLKADNIILLTHEKRKTVPLFLLEVLKKYGLYERFCKIVKGFANTYQLAEVKCAETVKSYSLYALCVVLLDKEEDLDSALDRARITSKLVQHLCAVEEEAGNKSAKPSETALAEMSENVRKIAMSIPQIEDELAGLKRLVERQNTLRPIFGNMIKTRHRSERYWASNLRRLVAEADLTYDDLVREWNETKADGIKNLITGRVIKFKKQQEVEELVETVIAHFDPEYKPSYPSKRTRGTSQSGSRSVEEPAAENKSNEKKSASETPEAAAANNQNVEVNSESSGISTPGNYASAPSSPDKQQQQEIAKKDSEAVEQNEEKETDQADSNTSR